MSVWAILVKENLVFLRSRRAALVMFAYLAGLAGVILWNWPADQILRLAAISSARMLYAIGMGQLILLVAIIPGLTSGSIVRERETGSLDLLYASRLTPLSILFGKWVGHVSFAVLLQLVAMPLVALGHVLGTLDFALLGSVYLHLFATAVWTGILGLAVSSRSRSSSTALVFTYAAVVLFSAVPVLPTFVVDIPLVAFLRNFSPVGAMVTLLTPDVWAVVAPTNVGVTGFQAYLAFSALVALVAARVAWKALSAPPSPRERKSKDLIEDTRKLRSRKLSFPFYLIDPQRRRRHIGDWVNPIFALELRSRLLGRSNAFIRIFYTVLIGSFLTTLLAVIFLDPELVDTMRIVVVASQVVLIGLLCPPLTSPAISRERERNTLDLVRLTHVSSHRFFLGKFYYALLESTFLLLASLPMWGVISMMQRIPLGGLLHAVAVILAALFSGTAAGLLASSLSRRSSVATGVAYSVTFVLFAWTIPILWLSTSLSSSVRAALLSLNPVVSAIHTVSREGFRRLLTDSSWQWATWSLTGAAVVFLIVVIVQTRRLYRVR